MGGDSTRWVAGVEGESPKMREFGSTSTLGRAKFGLVERFSVGLQGF
jgi:hypothetical protein